MRHNRMIQLAVLLALSANAGAAERALSEIRPSLPAPIAIKLAVAAQPIAEALNDFARQSGLHVVIGSDIAKGVTSTQMEGTFTPEAALSRMLANTGLKYEYLDDITIAVIAANNQTQNPSTGTGEEGALREGEGSGAPGMGGPNDPCSNPSPGTGEGGTAQRGMRSSEGSSSSSGPCPKAKWYTRLAQNDQESKDEGVSSDTSEGGVQLEEIVVTGTHIRRTDNEGPSPVIVITRDDIDRSGAASVGDLIQKLPQNTGSGDVSQWGAGTVDSSMAPNLRGLGVEATLTLINGRRPALSAAAQWFSDVPASFNLNTIALAAVERIEVLTDGASALYGSDAVGGVINVILRKDYSGLELASRYGRDIEGDANELTQSLVAGLTHNKTNVLFSVEYYDRDGILYADRDYSVRAGQQFVDATDRRAVPGNVAAVLGTGNLPGLNSPFAAVPRNQDGRSLQIADFAATQGTANPSIYQGLYDSLWAPQKRVVGSARLSHGLTDAVSLFLEGMVARLDTVFESVRGYQDMLIPAANPFNPFGADVQASFYLAQNSDRTETTTTDHAVIGGAEGSLRNGVDWEVFANFGKSHAESDDLRTDDTLVADALAQTDPSQALNVFGDGAGNSTALLESLKANTRHVEINTRTVAGGAKLALDLYDLPTGTVKGAFGAESRKETLDYLQVSRLASTGSQQQDRDVTAIYGELLVPLLSAHGKPGTSSPLELSLAGRYEKYSDFGSTSNPKIGVKWRALPSLLLRTSYGTSFIAPSFSQLDNLDAGREFSFPFPLFRVFDPVFGEVTRFSTLRFGASPGLQPEQAESLSAGIVFSPPRWPGVELSLNGYDILYTDKITYVGFRDAPRFESLHPDLVTRDLVTNRIVAITQKSVNLASVRSRGFDAGVQVAAPTAVGQFSFALNGTFVSDYRTKDGPGTATVERVDTLGNPVDKRFRTSVRFDRGQFGTGISVTYVDSYATESLAQTTIGSFTQTDVQASYTWGSPLQFNLTAGVENLFDRDPPYYSDFGTGFDFMQGDPRGRHVYARLRVIF